MGITGEQLKAVLQSANDGILSEIKSHVTTRGIAMDPAAKFSIQVGDTMFAQGGITQQELTKHVLAAFRAALYALLVANTGQSYANTNANVHNVLVQDLAKYKQYIESTSNTLGGLGLGVSASTTLGASTPSGIVVDTSNVAAPSDVLTRGVAVPPPAQTLDAALPPAAQIQQPVVAVAVPNPQKRAVLDLVDKLMEEYKEHELWPEQVRQISARVMNQQVTKFRESGKWADGLIEALTTRGYKTYEGCELMVTMQHRNEAFSFPSDTVYKAVVESIRSNWISVVVTALKKSIASDDSDVARQQLLNVIQAAEELTDTILKQTAIDAKASTVEVVIMQQLAVQLSRRVDNVLGYVVDRITAGGKLRLPGKMANCRMLLDHDRSDIGVLLNDVYNKSSGENGEVIDAAEFRQMFLSGLLAMAGIGFAFTDNVNRIAMVGECVEIVIGGEYPSLAKHDIISNQSLGSTYEPVCNIFETITREMPSATIALRTPTTYRPLVGSGEVGANIYY